MISLQAIREAANNGKEIQYRFLGGGEWRVLTSYFLFDSNRLRYLEFRIKPDVREVTGYTIRYCYKGTVLSTTFATLEEAERGLESAIRLHGSKLVSGIHIDVFEVEE